MEDSTKQLICAELNEFSIQLRSLEASIGMAVVEEWMLGDPMDKTNVFRWDTVVLNLPVMREYDPSKAWVAKVRYDDGEMRTDTWRQEMVTTYVRRSNVTSVTFETLWCGILWKKSGRHKGFSFNSASKFGCLLVHRKEHYGEKSIGGLKSIEDLSFLAVTKLIPLLFNGALPIGRFVWSNGSYSFVGTFH